MEHHFNTEEAKKYGIEGAILIYNIRFWILKNKANNRNFINGRYWTYNSVDAFSKLFTYMSRQKIARELRKLEELGVLVSDVLSENKYDKTKWYSLSETVLNHENTIVQNDNIDCSILNNRVFKNEQYISDNKPDNKQDNNIDDKQKKSFKKWDEKMFAESISQFKDKYGRLMLRDFYNYWIETDDKGKMRFQLQKTWDTNLRLKRWSNNNFNPGEKLVIKRAL
jgi:hypothetical protein